MSDFIYSTSSSTSGPWLIDADQLEKLDTIIEGEWEKLTARNEQSVDAEIKTLLAEDFVIKTLVRDINDDAKREAEMNSRKRELESRVRSHHDHKRSLTIHLKSDKKLDVKSFGEAFRHPDLLHETPDAFNLAIRSGNISATLELSKYGRLDLAVSPEHLNEARELFAALYRWVASVRPPRWQRSWAAITPLHWGAWILIVWLAALSLGDSEAAAKAFYKQQAKELMRDGISQDEQTKAIETILAFESNFIPEGQKTNTPGWFLLLLFGGLATCIVLTVLPKPRLGIGKGEESIHRWRLWMRVVFVIAPGFVFVNVIFPYLSQLIARIL